MTRNPRILIGAFGAWTLLMWAGRIRNVANDTTLTSVQRNVTLIPVMGFVAMGVVTLIVAMPTMTQRVRRYVVNAAAVVTWAFWGLRLIQIATRGDHSLGFVAVHVVLGTISGILAFAMWRSVRGVDQDNRSNDVLTEVSH